MKGTYGLFVFGVIVALLCFDPWAAEAQRLQKDADPLGLVVDLLTAEQAAAFAGGAEAAEILLADGRSLAAALDSIGGLGPERLVYVPLDPCALINTIGVSDPFAAGETRTYTFRGPNRDYSALGGSATGCGIPDLVGPAGSLRNGARALLLNFIASEPTGNGRVKTWAADVPEPNFNLVTFDVTTPPLRFSAISATNMCSEVGAAPCAGGDISIRTAASGANLRVTVLGYFETASEGDVTAVMAGAGLSGGGSAGDVTLSADFGAVQARVASTCPVGSSIRVIDGGGNVTCQSAGAGDGHSLDAADGSPTDVVLVDAAGVVQVDGESVFHSNLFVVSDASGTPTLSVGNDELIRARVASGFLPKVEVRSFEGGGHKNGVDLEAGQGAGGRVTVWDGVDAGDPTVEVTGRDTTGGFNLGTVDVDGRVRVGSRGGAGGTVEAEEVIATEYVQIPAVVGIPPLADCDQPSEAGRMRLDPSNARLYLCTNSGWTFK